MKLIPNPYDNEGERAQTAAAICPSLYRILLNDPDRGEHMLGFHATSLTQAERLGDMFNDLLDEEDMIGVANRLKRMLGWLHVLKAIAEVQDTEYMCLVEASRLMSLIRAELRGLESTHRWMSTAAQAA